MLEKVSRIAEQAATNVSRRQFLGRFGRGAAVAAAALGGLLALPAVAQGGKRVQICSSDSTSACSGVPVGDPCQSFGIRKGKCRPVNPGDKSPVVLCGCKSPRGPRR